MKLKDILTGGFVLLRKWFSADIIAYQMEHNNIILEHQRVQDEMIKQLIEDNKELHQELRETRADILRLKIVNKDMPLKERVLAGEVYVNEMHLNGDIKAQSEVLAEEYKEVIRNQENGGNVNGKKRDRR